MLCRMDRKKARDPYTIPESGRSREARVFLSILTRNFDNEITGYVYHLTRKIKQRTATEVGKYRFNVMIDFTAITDVPT